MFRTVVVLWLSFVCYYTHGFPHGGRVTPVNKRSDYSMYDNQFFSVGDTRLDNEVTDCGLVRHQYARGYIRLREFLERMQGCGEKGKMANVAAIAASTKDAEDFPADYSLVTKQPAVKAAPFKPHPIGELIENAGRTKPKIAAYQNQGLKPQLPNPQQGAQRSQTGINNFGFFNQENGPLSYLPNPASTSIQTPLARKLITRKNMNIPQQQALQNLATAKSQDFPDPQRYYSDQTSALARPAYTAPVTVGQPLFRPNPLALAFHKHMPVPSASITPPSQPQAYQPVNPDQQVDKMKLLASASASITRPSQPQAYQPVNPDQQVDKVKQFIQSVTSQSVVKPVKQATQVQSAKIRDDIGGEQIYDEGVQDEADEAGIDHQESDPLPPETSFSYNPRLEEEDTSKIEDAKVDAENSNPHNLPNIPAATPPLNSVPGKSDDISNGPLPHKGPEKTPSVGTPPQNLQSTHNEQITPQKPQPLATAHKPQNVQQTPNVPKAPQNVQTSAQNTHDKAPPLSSPAVPEVVKGDDFQGNSGPSNKLDDFLKPASTNNVKPEEPENDAQPNFDQPTPVTENEPNSAPTTPKKKHGLAINLGVLKNRISTSKDVGFLKRMLTLIKKITHHKDFNKLGGVQQSAIMQAGEAVHSAVAKKGNTPRSFILPHPPYWKPGEYTTQGYTTPNYGPPSGTQNNVQLAMQGNAQRSFIQTHPPKWKPGDYTEYGTAPYTGSQANYAYPAYQTHVPYQAHVQYHPPNWKIGDYTAGTDRPNAQLYNARQSQITKKFQIERNPYYQAQAQRPAAYKPPYFSLQRLNYGLYNGNTP